MATARLLPSTYQLSSTSYLKITNPNNMYTNTDSTTYATVTNSQTGTTSYYLYVRGFDFSAIPSDATVTSFTVKLKASESGGSTSTSYRPYLCNNTTALTNCYSDVLSTSAKTVSFACTYSWDEVKAYGANFGIRINCRRNNRNTQATFNIYGAEIEVEYTVPVPRDITTSGVGCTVKPSGTTTVYEGNSFTVAIEASTKPTITDNGTDVTNQLVEIQPTLEPTITTAPSASYGFALNSNGYYESQNKGKASSAAVCVVSFELPVACTVTFSLINYAESTYDYGLLSNLDTTLTNNASADTSNVYWNGKNNNSASVQTVTYNVSAGSHSIYVKYFKDSYTDSNNDTLQFKVSITPKEQWSADVYYVYTISNVESDHTIIATVGAAAKDTLYIKLNGAVKEVTTVYKKVGGVWVEQTSLKTLFDTGTNYVKG